MITCAAPDYLKRHGAPRRPEEVLDHEALLFRDPQSNCPPSRGSFIDEAKFVSCAISGQVVMDDPSAALAACEAGQSLFQSLELGLAPWLQSGRLVQVLNDRAEELFPLYALYPSRRQAPAKVRAFLRLRPGDRRVFLGRELINSRDTTVAYDPLCGGSAA